MNNGGENCSICNINFIEKNIHIIDTYPKLLLIFLYEYNDFTTFKLILSEEKNIFGAKLEEKPLMYLCKRCFIMYKHFALNKFEKCYPSIYENWNTDINMASEIKKLEDLEETINAFSSEFFFKLALENYIRNDSPNKFFIIKKIFPKKLKMKRNKKKGGKDLPLIKDFNVNLINSLFL